MKVMFFDLETTGVHSQCGIHQLSGCFAEIIENKIIEREKFDFKMQPFKGCRVYDEALEIGNINIDILQGYKNPMDVYKEFTKMITRHVNKFKPEDKLILIGYNRLSFDNNFLRAWFTSCGDKFFGSYFWSGGIDVMSESLRTLMEIRPYMPNFKLGTVARMFDIKFDETGLHDGLFDVNLTMKIFEQILLDPKPRSLRGINIGKLREEVNAYKEEMKNSKPRNNNYVIY